MIFHSLLHNRNPSFPKGRSSPLVRYDIILWNDSQSQWKILHRLTAACQMCQTHHLSMQRHHSTKSAWRHPLKRHTFSGSKWQVEPVRHHMGGSGTRLASPSKRHKLLPHGGVCVRLSHESNDSQLATWSQCPLDGWPRRNTAEHDAVLSWPLKSKTAHPLHLRSRVDATSTGFPVPAIAFSFPSRMRKLGLWSSKKLKTEALFTVFLDFPVCL